MTCQVQNCNARAIPGKPYCSRCKEEINGTPVSIKESGEGDHHD